MQQCLEDLNIGQFEYAFLSNDTSYSSSSFNMYIPKLMPLIAQGEPKSTNETIDNNIFVNASDCKPTTSGTVQTQNYVKVKAFSNLDLQFKGDINGIIHKGARFMLLVMDKNIGDMYVTDNI